MSESHPQTTRERAEHADAGTDPALERELRAVSALLRGLPQPSPPSQLFDRLMAEVARREARPRVVRLLDRLPEPLTGLALAAGIGCLALFGAVESGLLDATGAADASRQARTVRLEPSVARPIAIADASAVRARRPVVPSFASAAVIDPQLAAFVVDPGPEPLPGALAAGAPRRSSPVDGSLDRQLNHLLLDPVSFYRRIEQIRDPQSFVGRLAERAARRGDAAEVALRLRLRAAEHPETDRMVERFLRAALDLRLTTQR